MTELGGAVVCRTPENKKLESAGYVVPNVVLKVVDVNTGEALGPNKQGECYVKVPTTMVCYYKNPTATAEILDEEGIVTFFCDLKLSISAWFYPTGWIHSGDVVYYDEEGEIVVVDRIKEVMKYRGYHVSPSELEDIIQKHPAVMEVAVVAVPHEIDLERPMAFVKKAPDQEVIFFFIIISFA